MTENGEVPAQTPKPAKSKPKPWSRAEVIQLVYRSPRDSLQAVAERTGRSLSEVNQKQAEYGRRWHEGKVTAETYVAEHQ
jgi:hypothetical protein